MAVTLKHVVEQAPGGFRIYERPDYRVIGRFTTLVGLLLAPGLLAFSRLGSLTTLVLAVLGVMGGASALVGALFWALARRSCFVSTSGREVLTDGGQCIAFDSVVAVLVSSYVQTVRTQHGKTTARRYVAEVATKQTDAEAAAALEGALQALAASAADDPAAARLRAELEQQAEKITGEAVRLVDHGDLLRVWLVAELLAKTLQVPILEAFGPGFEERTVAELDQPLYERLRGRGVSVEAPGPVPAGILVEVSSEERFVASWETGVFSGRKTLAIDASGARFGRDAMPLHAIETVRAETELYPAVLLISDARAIRCRVRHDPQAVWLEQAVRHAICRVASRQPGPRAAYR